MKQLNKMFILIQRHWKQNWKNTRKAKQPSNHSKCHEQNKDKIDSLVTEKTAS